MTRKGFGLREWIILAVVLLSGYSLWPSIEYHSKQGDEKIQFARENPKVVGKSVNFGLDLAGGTSIILEIDKSGLKPDEASDIQERALEIIRNRVDQYGLSEPQIYPSGDSRIVADLAGVDADDARNLVGGTALLEFKIVAEQERAAQTLTAIDNYLKGRNLPGTDTLSAPSDTATVAPQEIDEMSLEDLTLAGSRQPETPPEEEKKSDADYVNPDRPFTGYLISYGSDLAIPEEHVSRVQAILKMPGVQDRIPRDVEFALGRGFETQENGNKLKKLYLLKRRAEMDGKEIATASPYRISDGLSAGQVAVSLRFKGMGPKKFGSVTGNNIGKQMAIVLDGQVISAPVIRDRIPNGEAQITGLADFAEATQLAVVLRAGALPAPMTIVELRNVGASLGEENIRAGFGSAIVGFIICLVFMLFYYSFAGVVANVGIFVNMLMIGAALSLFNATLTLPGIAGMLLVAAMALDANIIIYERIREELRAGQMARMAVAKGYEKAFTAIIDSNITTFFVAFILYKIGTGPVKGFGLTLMVGIAASLFSALTVTRAIFDFKLSKHDAKTISIGRGIKWLQEAKFQIVSKRGIWAKLSLTVCAICIGLAIFKGFEYSIDFTGGMVYTVEYADELGHTENLKDALAKGDLGDITVRKLGGTILNQYMLSIQTDDSGEKAVAALTAKLNAALENIGTPRIVGSDVVGPTIGKELRFNAILAIILSWLGIGIYIWARFGKMGLGFGVGAIITLIHDTIWCIGLISIFKLPIDGAMIAAFLAMIGYSINDTIVIYDRIRENRLLAKETLEDRINISINQSFSRSIITSSSTLFVCVVLAIMGGSSIRDFGIVMSVGIVIGTYSSICISAPFLVWWSKKFKRGMG
uniref:Multifunctional fusion protein n=1 Tax=uncultured bacterium contig00028 TaxID=1181517 RepID=A0A806KE96_9BACT|nr:protein-export membrane protein SecD (TC 3.A.5.1.1) [uncultured bacterium contig00028]